MGLAEEGVYGVGWGVKGVEPGRVEEGCSEARCKRCMRQPLIDPETPPRLAVAPQTRD